MMKNKLQKIIFEALKKSENQEVLTGFGVEKIQIDYSKDPKFGDFSTNVAMILAGKLKKNPLEIAKKIIKEIEKQNFETIEKVEVAKPGYINFYLSPKYFSDLIMKINLEEEEFGKGKNIQKIMVEYSQPNTNKELHIGHLRNIFIGNSLVNLLRKSGNEVVAANYVGDTGTHIAKSLWGFLKFHSKEELDLAERKTEFLGKVYSEANQKLEENSELENEFREVQAKIDEKDPELTDLWNKTRKISLDDFRRIYEKLGVSFDVYFFESEEEKTGKKMVDDLLEKGIIEKSQGAIIANLEKFKLGVLVLMRKNGSVLYGLKDIPLAIKKFEEFEIEKSIYIVDVRQSFYFKQIEKILELLGFENKITHIGYDFVSLQGGESMSSRKGNIISAETLMNDAVKKVKEKFPNSPDSESIGIGAIKFFMLKYSPETKIEFDLEKALSLEGNTGPYVQYAYARMASILGKAKEIKTESKPNLNLLVHEKELNLIRELEKFPGLIEEISETYEVHKMPYFAISLADKFHSFYNDCQVIDEDNLEITTARLELVKATKIVLKEALGLIGVLAPDKM